jgi:hypothetical protein
MGKAIDNENGIRLMLRDSTTELQAGEKKLVAEINPHSSLMQERTANLTCDSNHKGRRVIRA